MRDLGEDRVRQQEDQEGSDCHCPIGMRMVAAEERQVVRFRMYLSGRAFSTCQWVGCKR